MTQPTSTVAPIALRLVLIATGVLLLASCTVYKTRLGDWTSFWHQGALTNLQHEAGHAYRADTGRLQLGAHERPSPAQILENGRIPGLPNRPQAEIEERGEGRFTFWRDQVYFSTSDNSNPLTNGRQYTFWYPAFGRDASRALYGITLVFLLMAAALAMRHLRAHGATSLWRTSGLATLREAASASYRLIQQRAEETLSHSRKARAAAAERAGSSPSVALTPQAQRSAAWPLAATAVVGAFAASASIDPAYVFDRVWVLVARLSSCGLLIAAGYFSIAWSRARLNPWVALSRLGSLLAIAAFVWIRPGVSLNGIPTAGFVILGTSILMVAGIVLHFVVPVRLRDGLERFCARPEGRSVAMLLGATALFTALAAAPSLARNWDMSGYMDSYSYDTYAMNIITGKVPQGNSAYMPVYQYGLAFIYYVFGHFFFVQQIVNLLFVTGSVVALCLAAWILFESGAAVIVVGILAVFSRQFFYAVFFTQIESWYIPFICFLLLAWARYWRQPSWANLAWLGGMVALGMNTRNQGALFFGFVCAAPLWVAGLEWRRRLAQVATIGLLVAASLVPWTLRNYMVEGRLSPSGSRSAMYVGVQNDRRVGLYGIRYWEGWNDVVAEFAARYPDPSERERAYVRAGWTNVVSDPAWLARALFWRTGAFYGVLPNGVLDLSRIVPTDWAAEWQGYVYWRTTPLLLLPLSIIGVLFRPDRTSVFLLAAIASNLVILIFAATPEDRISYPVLTMHILLAAGLFAGKQRPPRSNPAPRHDRRKVWVAAALSLIVFLVVCRIVVGARFTYRPLIEKGVAIVPTLDLDESLPLLNEYMDAGGPPETAGLGVGQRVRVRCMVSNYMNPPKFAGAVGGLPPFATDPSRETYYYAYPVTEGGAQESAGLIGMTFQGAQLSDTIREGDAVDIEGLIVHSPTAEQPGYWVRAILVRKLPIPTSALPAFQ